MGQPYREDLLLAAYAVALGFEIHGGYHSEPLKPDHFAADGIPGHGLTFKRKLPVPVLSTELIGATSVTVWSTARGWRVARLINDRYEPMDSSQFHRKLKDALDAAHKF